MKILNFIVFVLLVLFISGCSQNYNKINNKNINVYSGEKINLDEDFRMNFDIPEKLTNKQKKEFEVRVEKAKKIIRHLTGESKIIYDFKTKTFNSLLNNNIIPDLCKSEDIDYFFKCLVKNNVNLNDIIKYVPKKEINYVKKRYYIQKYSTTPKSLFQSSNDPIELEIKQKFITNYISNGIITRKQTCYKIPEKSLQNYCLEYFNN